jgi:aspartate aminotransferase-like enzyme
VPADIAAAVKKGGFTHVGMIHHETTAGTLNDVEGVGARCHYMVQPLVELYGGRMVVLKVS